MRASLSTKKGVKTHLNGWLQQQPGRALPTAHILAATVALLAVTSCCVYTVKIFRTHLLVQNVLDTPILEPPTNLVLDVQQHAADEMLLRQLVDECLKQQQSAMHLDSQRRIVTSSSINPQHCPALDIVLPARGRTLGACTDAALYVIHVGGRLIGMPADVAAYDGYCGAQTARLFLDVIYPELISKLRRVLHMQLVRPSLMQPQHARLRARMQAFLCETRHCTALMQQHVVEHGYWSSVWHVGLGSADATVGTSGDVISAVQDSVTHGNPRGFALHVQSAKLEQTKAVLKCWEKQAEYLPLVVVGRPAEVGLTAANIMYQTPDAAAAAAAPGTDVVSSVLHGFTAAAAPAALYRVKSLQAAAALQVIPALNEGSLHEHNEARAAGALIVATDQLPMSELVTSEQGLLVPAEQAGSAKALSSSSGSGSKQAGSPAGVVVTSVDARVSSDALCRVVQQALMLPAAEAAAKRAAAAAHYKADQAAFVQRAAQLRAHLQARSAKAAGTDAVSPAAEAAAASIVQAVGGAAAEAGVDAESSTGQAVLGRKVGPAQ